MPLAGFIEINPVGLKPMPHKCGCHLPHKKGVFWLKAVL